METSDSFVFVPISSKPPPKNNSKRRRGGPVQLQFLTATEPSQFKDEKARKSVRSQAMRHYRSAPKKKGYQLADEARLVSQTYLGREAHDVEEITRHTTSQENHGKQSFEIPDTRRPKQALTSSMLSWLEAFSFDWPAEEAALQPPGYALCPWESSQDSSSKEYGKRHSLVCRSQKPTAEEATNARDRSIWPMFAATLTHLWGTNHTVDPFAVLPQYRNRELNSTLLVRICARAFSSEATVRIWVPAICQHEHIYLSAGILTSTWLDMATGHSGDSKRTALVKEELYSYLKERMLSRTQRTEDGTLMIIFHLISGEMWNADERTLAVHCSAATRIIMLRGGMTSFPTEHHRHVALVCLWQCHIISEKKRTSPLFQDYELPAYTLPDNIRSAPLESPLFCPSVDMKGVKDDAQCHNLTYGLLCDMRELTDLFIAFHATVSGTHEDQGRPRRCILRAEYDERTHEICMRVASLPSAKASGTPVHKDWIYEAWRLAALIYTSAILARVPFSTAADPEQNFMFNDPVLVYTTRVHRNLCSRRLNETLYEVLERTDTGDLWSGMIGVFYWVTAVGAAASRTQTTIHPTNSNLPHSEAHAMWVRRCFVMYAMRAVILSVFEHSLPTVSAQDTLLKVQELLSPSGATAKLLV